jgi:hypothetical protein
MLVLSSPLAFERLYATMRFLVLIPPPLEDGFSCIMHSVLAFYYSILNKSSCMVRLQVSTQSGD